MKTGKIITDSADYIQDNSAAMQLASGPDDKNFRPEPGMIRYNEDIGLVELYTAGYGWNALSTEQMLRPDGAPDMQSGVMKVLQQVKRVATGTIHIQGGSGNAGIGSYNLHAAHKVAQPLTGAFSPWSGSSGTYKGMEPSQGPNFMLFHVTTQPFPRRWEVGFNIDACQLTGLADSQRYNFMYTNFAGFSGYSSQIFYGHSGRGNNGSKLDVDIKTFPLWSVNPLPDTFASDTDPDYGKFFVLASGNIYDSVNFDAEFSMYFSAKQFKNF